ncbi:Protein of unknown function [Bacillus cereus]|nr:Protein of unknown function [Bacillus mobilis]SCN03337.1 Protein of unknown function [Bacillus cereus]
MLLSNGWTVIGV